MNASEISSVELTVPALIKEEYVTTTQEKKLYTWFSSLHTQTTQNMRISFHPKFQILKSNKWHSFPCQQ